MNTSKESNGGNGSKASNASSAGNTVIVRLFLGHIDCFYLLSKNENVDLGMFGAVEDGQEEAVRFFEAWKAEVARFNVTSLKIYKKKLIWANMRQHSYVGR